MLVVNYGVKCMNKIYETYKKLVIERLEISNFPNNLVLIPRIKDNSFIFLLYDIKDERPISYIAVTYDSEVDVYTVDGAYSNIHGYGPFMYESAMTYVYPKGLTASRHGSTSGDALDVWEKFQQRGDVKKERINYKGITHKREDLPNGGMDQKFIDKSLEIEDTKFFYSYGKELLMGLLAKGNKVLKELGWDLDKEYEYKLWDLE